MIQPRGFSHSLRVQGRSTISTRDRVGDLIVLSEETSIEALRNSMSETVGILMGGAFDKLASTFVNNARMSLIGIILGGLFL